MASERGGGKYGSEAEGVMASTRADGVLLFVLGGSRGSGFSVVTKVDAMSPSDIVRILRETADSIERGGVD